MHGDLVAGVLTVPASGDKRAGGQGEEVLYPVKISPMLPVASLPSGSV